MCAGAVHVSRSEEDSDDTTEKRSPKADENAIRASSSRSRGRQHRDHRGVGHWDGSLSDGGGNDRRATTEGDEWLGGVWWRCGDGDERRARGVERDSWGIDDWGDGVVGVDDWVATGGYTGSNGLDGSSSNGLDRDRFDGWRVGGNGWRSGVADGAWAVWRRVSLDRMGWGGGVLTGDGQRRGLGDGVGLDSLSEGGWAGADRDVGGNGGDDPDIDSLAGNWSVNDLAGNWSVDDLGDGSSWILAGPSDGSSVSGDLGADSSVDRSGGSFSLSRG